MMPTVSSTSPSSAATSQGAPSGSTATPPVDKNMFLQLLVAQLQNQDPLNPTDGTQFVGELAQFQQLEQTANTGEDITAIRQDIEQMMQGSNSTNGQTNSTSGQTNTTTGQINSTNGQS